MLGLWLLLARCNPTHSFSTESEEGTKLNFKLLIFGALTKYGFNPQGTDNEQKTPRSGPPAFWGRACPVL